MELGSGGWLVRTKLETLKPMGRLMFMLNRLKRLSKWFTLANSIAWNKIRVQQRFVQWLASEKPRNWLRGKPRNIGGAYFLLQKRSLFSLQSVSAKNKFNPLWNSPGKARKSDSRPTNQLPPESLRLGSPTFSKLGLSPSYSAEEH